MIRIPAVRTWLLLREHAASRRDVGLLNDDRISTLGGLQRYRIAASRRSHRLRINWRRTILADHAIPALVEADGPTDLARIKDGRDFPIWFAIEPEAHISAILFRLETVQIAV